MIFNRSLMFIRYRYIRSRDVHILQSRGVGVFGALGLGKFDDEVHFKTVNVCGKNVKYVSAGFGHSAIITTDGQLAVCGRGFDLGSLFKSYGIYRVLPLFAVWAAKITLSDSSRAGEILLEPFLMTELFKHNVVHVAASGGLTLALTDKGKLFSFGANLFGQCGLGVDKNRIWKPVTPISLPPVLWCDTGLQHGICVCDGGEVYCWGKGQNGQMGNNSVEEINSYPIKVSLTQPCIAVASGLNHCVAIGADGTIYVWGRRMSLELEKNREQTYKDQLVPRALSLPDGRKAKRVFCSSFCTVVVAEDRTLWAMGVDEAASAVYPSPIPVLCPFDYDAHEGKTDVELSELAEFQRPYQLHDGDIVKKGYYAVAMISANRDKVFEVVINNGGARLQEIELAPRAEGKIIDFSTGFRHTMIVVSSDEDGENKIDDD